jgi:hypothetical protein
MKTAQEIAAIFGCTPEPVRQQQAANAKQLSGLAERARKAPSGKLYGLTAQNLQERGEKFAAAAGVSA